METTAFDRVILDEFIDDSEEQVVFCKGWIDKEFFSKLAKEFIKDSYGDDMEVELDESIHSFLSLNEQSNTNPFKATIAGFNYY